MSKIANKSPHAIGVNEIVLPPTDIAGLSLPYATAWVECAYHPLASLDVYGTNLAGVAVNIEVANRERGAGHVKATGGEGLYPLTYGSALARVVITAGTGSIAICYAGTPQA